MPARRKSFCFCMRTAPVLRQETMPVDYLDYIRKELLKAADVLADEGAVHVRLAAAAWFLESLVNEDLPGWVREEIIALVHDMRKRPAQAGKETARALTLEEATDVMERVFGIFREYVRRGASAESTQGEPALL
jgi:hypothetical protein